MTPSKRTRKLQTPCAWCVLAAVPILEVSFIRTQTGPLTCGAVQAAMVDVFRSRGHLAAPLDPLGRASRAHGLLRRPSAAHRLLCEAQA